MYKRFALRFAPVVVLWYCIKFNRKQMANTIDLIVIMPLYYSLSLFYSAHKQLSLHQFAIYFVHWISSY